MTSTIPVDDQPSVAADASPIANVRVASPLADPAAAEAIIAGLRLAVRELRCIASQRLLRRGLSMTQFYVLSLLDRHGEVPMSRLADILGISDSNATGLVDRMEERELVQRARMSGDRRVVLVRITDAGTSLLADVEFLDDELVDRVLAELDPKQLARVRLAVDDVRTALGRVAATGSDLLQHRHPSST